MLSLSNVRAPITRSAPVARPCSTSRGTSSGRCCPVRIQKQDVRVIAARDAVQAVAEANPLPTVSAQDEGHAAPAPRPPPRCRRSTVVHDDDVCHVRLDAGDHRFHVSASIEARDELHRLSWGFSGRRPPGPVRGRDSSSVTNRLPPRSRSRSMTPGSEASIASDPGPERSCRRMNRAPAGPCPESCGPRASARSALVS